MALKRPSALTLLTTALLVLLPTLAVLQYRWVGQVNDAERDRMQRNLRTAAVQFREAFDGEIVRAVFGLRVEAGIVREGAWHRYADRYEAWAETATHPAVIANVYLVDADGARLRLRRWDPAAHVFEETAWPAPLAAWRPHFEDELASIMTGQRPDENRRPGADDSLLIAPLLNTFARPAPGSGALPPQPLFGFTILQLDMDEIRDVVLPALVQRHFTNTDGDRYRVAVTTGRMPRRVVYQSDPAAVIDPDSADAREPLHGALANADAFFFRAPGPPQRRGDRAGDGGRNVIVEMFSDRRSGERRISTVRTRVLNRDGSRWLLLVQHERGSLEAAVAAVRRRNLAISFGTLLLLTISVVLLAMSSRRQQRLARQQMEFVAGVSHELRTPVAVIRSAAENLSQGVVVAGDRVRRYGEVIEVEAKRLGDMVERVLQYAGLDAAAGVAARTPLPPADIVNAAIDTAGPALGAVQLQRRIADDLPPVLGDAAALRSAVQNLIVNAAKYGGESGSISVTVDRHAQGRRQEVWIAVEDHGPGIAADELRHVFEPFYRGADAVARQVQGNGLGLALVQRIVASHGGRIGVTSSSGRTVFTIALPAVGPVAQTAVDRAGGTLEGTARS